VYCYYLSSLNSFTRRSTSAALSCSRPAEATVFSGAAVGRGGTTP